MITDFCQGGIKMVKKRLSFHSVLGQLDTHMERNEIGFLSHTIGEGTANPLLYSYLENPMDRGAWWAVVQGVAKSWTQLNN